jgi:Fe-S cluster biogenesis protein NfuA
VWVESRDVRGPSRGGAEKSADSTDFRQCPVGRGFAPSTDVLTTTEAIEAVFERIRPALNADGGDIELIALDGRVARVRLTGVCARCPSAEMTLRSGIETAVRRIDPSLRVERVA